LKGKIKEDRGKTITARQGKQRKDYESKTPPRNAREHRSDKKAKSSNDGAMRRHKNHQNQAKQSRVKTRLCPRQKRHPRTNQARLQKQTYGTTKNHKNQVETRIRQGIR
jgi:hypothetical protein